MPDTDISAPAGGWLKAPQVAEILDVSAETVRVWCADRRIESMRTPGGHYRIPAAAVKSLLDCDRGAQP